MTEQNDKDDQQDKAQRLRLRVATGCLAAGALALFLSFSLPWVHYGRGFGPMFDDDGNLALSPSYVRDVGNGWELLAAAVGDDRWAMTTALAAVLLTAVLACVALVLERRGLHIAVQIAGCAAPVLLLLVWPPLSFLGPGPEVGSGPWVAAAACVLVAAGAFSAVSDVDRPGNAGPEV